MINRSILVPFPSAIMIYVLPLVSRITAPMEVRLSEYIRLPIYHLIRLDEQRKLSTKQGIALMCNACCTRHHGNPSYNWCLRARFHRPPPFTVSSYSTFPRGLFFRNHTDKIALGVMSRGLAVHVVSLIPATVGGTY